MIAYDYKCAFCGLSFIEALEAAHIVPWSKASSKERMSPNNGILLCANHHKLFDSGWVEISDDYKIKHIDENYQENHYSTSDVEATVNIDDKRIILPSDKNLWPSKALITQRNETNKR